MQVSQVNETVTHAVISNKKAQDFGISNSAEFFNILSNTLYSNKILAVVREVLCNAWDIHIQTGRTDKPVHVNLSEGKLTIRDFGSGISNEDIHPIYAVYGNSTKKLDGKQTGGFGLGSKAPFAYVDHFEVTSWYDSMKTIYAVSKSNAEVGGKPSIMPILSIPCGDETGLEVSLNVHHSDTEEFKNIIRMIARFGEMNVLFNGSQHLPTIPFSQAKHGFVLIQDMDHVSGANNNRIFVRYGNVVYPIELNSAYSFEFNKVLKLLDLIGARNLHYAYDRKVWKAIFQAKPDTISVTPSRESLSMTDHTINSIKDLFEPFLKLATTQLHDEVIKLEYQAIEAMWSTTSARPADLLTSDNEVPSFSDREYGPKRTTISVAAPILITDAKGMGAAYINTTYPTFDGFRKKDVEMRLTALEKHGFGGPKNRGKLQSFRREYDARGNADGSAWFQKTIVNPLTKRLDEVPELSGSKLLVYGNHKDTSVDKLGRRRFYDARTSFIEARKLSKRQLEDYMPFLRNIIVLSFNRLDVEERLPSFPIFKETLGQTREFLVYIVSRTDKKIDIVRKFFQDQGMVIVDLTKRQEWEHVEVLKPIPKAGPVKPRKKGLPKLNSILEVRPIRSISRNDPPQNETIIAHSRLKPDHEAYETLSRIENPQFIAKINPRAQSFEMIYNLDRNSELAVIQLYGDLGGIVVNDNQALRFEKELNIPRIDPWIRTKLLEEATTNKLIQLAFEFQKGQENLGMTSYDQTGLLRTIMCSQELSMEFNILNDMGPKEIMLYDLISSFVARFNRYGTDKNAQAIRAHIDGITVSPEVAELMDKMYSSKLVGLLDTSDFSGIFGATPTEHQKKQKSGALDLLLYAIEG